MRLVFVLHVQFGYGFLALLEMTGEPHLCHAERSEASILYGFLTAFGMTLSVLCC